MSPVLLAHPPQIRDLIFHVHAVFCTCVDAWQVIDTKNPQQIFHIAADWDTGQTAELHLCAAALDWVFAECFTGTDFLLRCQARRAQRPKRPPSSEEQHYTG